MATEDRCCPRCGRRSLRPVETAGQTNFLCGTCHRCWYPEYRHLIEVNRYACGGCADRTLCKPI
jgi:hypothetical protein